MQNEKIYEIIVEVLKNRLNVNPVILTHNNFNVPLTNRLFGFTARDLMYLFFEIERAFKINIDVNHLNHNKFNTITGIYELVAEKTMCV